MAKRSRLEQEQAGIPVVQLATRVPKGLYKQLKLFAVGEGISISDLVTEGLTLALAKHGVKVAA